MGGTEPKSDELFSKKEKPGKKHQKNQETNQEKTGKMRQFPLPFLFCFYLVEAQDVSLRTLFTAYTGFPDCARQPILVRSSRALLAIYEGRPGIFPHDMCSGVFYPSAPDFPIYVRRSFDDGSTWDSPINLTHGNLDFLVSVYDQVKNRVLLLVQQGDSGTIQLESSDHGASWRAPRVLNISSPGYSLIPGVGHGLQVDGRLCRDTSCAGAAGRLILPFVVTKNGPVSNDTVCGNCATALVWSGDGGQSWTLGAISSQNGSREAAIVQLNSTQHPESTGAAIYVNERNLGAHPGERWHTTSLDSGVSFSQAGTDPDLPDVVTANWTGVVAGLARFYSSELGGPFLAFTAPYTRGARANLSLWITREDEVSQGGWQSPPSLSIWSGPAAYSDIVDLNSSHIGVVFEGGAQEFAGGLFFAAVSKAAIANSL